MVGSSVTMAMANYTQVEQLGLKQRVYTLAVLKPPAEAINLINRYAASNISYPQITYPLEPGSLVIPGQRPGEEPRRYSERLAESCPGSSPARMPNLMPVEDQSTQTGSTRPESQALQQGKSDYHQSQAPVVDPEKKATQLNPQPSAEHQRTNPYSPKRGESFSKRDQQAKRTFAILTTNPGDNPWDLESRLLNFKTVMGTKAWDWFLPIRESPCCNHEHSESRYALGPTVDLLKAKVYFKSAADIRVKKGSKRFEIWQLPAIDEPSQLAADGNNQQVVDEAHLRVVSEAFVNDDNQHDPGGQISLANLNSRGEQIQPA
jgi:palmitoyltransferase